MESFEKRNKFYDTGFLIDYVYKITKNKKPENCLSKIIATFVRDGKLVLDENINREDLVSIIPIIIDSIKINEPKLFNQITNALNLTDYICDHLIEEVPPTFANIIPKSKTNRHLFCITLIISRALLSKDFQLIDFLAISVLYTYLQNIVSSYMQEIMSEINFINENAIGNA